MKKVKSQLHLSIVIFAVAMAVSVLWAVLHIAYPNSWFTLLTKFMLTLNIFVGMAQTVRFLVARKQAENYINAFEQQPPSDAHERLQQHNVVLNKLNWLANEFLMTCDTEQRLRRQLSSEQDANKAGEDMELLLSIHRAEVRVRATKQAFRDAQNAAVFFGYKVPKRAKSLLTCNSIL